MASRSKLRFMLLLTTVLFTGPALVLMALSFLPGITLVLSPLNCFLAGLVLVIYDSLIAFAFNTTL
jgi:uncharacterized membrane protein